MTVDLGAQSGRKVIYIARYDYPRSNVKAGQEFHAIGDVPANVAVTPVVVEN